MVPISSATRDSTKTATTSGRCMARCAYRKYKRVKMNCMASSATRRLSGFGEQFTLIQPTDDTSELRKNEKDNGNRFSSVPLSDPHRVNGYQHRSHGQGQEWVQNPSGDPQAEGGISTSTLANHRLQPWSSNPRHISAILLRTTSLTRLENILDQHAPFLNARHISIALSILPDIADGSRRVASTSSTYEEGLDEPKQNGLQSSAHARAKRVRVLSLLSRLTVAFGRYLSEYEPRDFAAASRSLGKIECSPPGADGGKRWMENLLSASLQGQGLKRFQSRELSTFLWGLAKIKLSKTYGDSCLPSFGVGVGLELMTRAKERALEIASATEDALTASPLGWEGLGGSIATPQGLSVILWSLVNLCMGTSDTCLPSGAELDPEETDVEAASNQRGLSSLLPASWIDEYLSVLSKPAIIKSLDTKNVCMSLGALARCSSGSSSYRPPPLLVHRLLHRLLSQCSATPTADERQWVILQCRRVLAESTPKAAQREGFTDDPRCIVEALWSLAKLGFRPGKDVMSRLCHTSQAFLAGGKMSGRESVILLWSMAVLRAEVDDTWLREYERATMRLIQSDFTAQGLSCSVWAMSKLGFRPGFAWMDAVMTVSAERLDLPFQPL